LKPKCDEPLLSLAFNLNLRRYSTSYRLTLVVCCAFPPLIFGAMWQVRYT
jgi:hypothetical protein